MPSRRTAKLLWPGPPSRAPLTQQCPLGTGNQLESQPLWVPNAPGPDRAVLYWPNLFHSCTGPELHCCWMHAPFPNTPSSSEQLRNSKSRMIPSGGLLDKTDKWQMQPVQDLKACIFLVCYHMELRKPNSHVLISSVCCEEPKVTGSLFFCGLPLKCGCHQCSAGPTQKVPFDPSP